MNTTKTMTEMSIEIDIVTLSLCAARPILGDQLAAIKGTGVSSVSAGDAQLLVSVPSIKSGIAGDLGYAGPVRTRSFTTTPKFADGVGSSASWRHPV